MDSLSIIRLSQTFAGSEDDKTNKRTSNASAESAQDGDVTPGSLAVDLVHYRELFSKLRFSYIEQVTKEKFLRAITSDVPLFVEPSENARLEQQLAEEKVALKAQKEDVEKLLQELQDTGKQLAKRYEQVQLQQAKLADLPDKIELLEAQIQQLEAAHPSPAKSSDPELNLSLPATQALFSERNAAVSDLDAQIRALQSSVPRKQRELKRLEDELHPLINQRKDIVAQAQEARRLRETGGVDEMEEAGRWYRASEAVLTEVLGVEH